MVLDKRPSGPVAIEIGSDNPDVIVRPTLLSFSSVSEGSLRWAGPQWVTITAAHDSNDAHEQATITHRVQGQSAAEYAALASVTLTITVTDDEAPADATAPVLESAMVNGATLTLAYSEQLDAGSAPGPGAFTVTVAGSARTVTGVAVSGSTVTLTLSSAVERGETVTVGYAVPAANPIQDVLGNEALALTDRSVTNNTPVVSPDDEHPLPDLVTVNGATLTLVFDEALDTGSVPPADAFEVEVDGSVVSLAAGNAVAISGRKVTLTLATAVTAGQEVEVYYHWRLAPAGHRIRDLFGNYSGYFSSSVYNVTGDTTAPSLRTATVNGASLTLGYDEELDLLSVPAARAFRVTVAGSARTVLSVSVGYRGVGLTLASAVTAGQAVTLDYTVPANNPIRDLAGNAAAAFADREVTSGAAGAAEARVAPAVTGDPAVTEPSGNGVYAAGERIEARVRFTAPVTVNRTGGSPTLGLALGGVRREAAYAGGSETAELVFAWTAVEADDGAGAAKAVANGIRLNGATIRSADGADAVLDYGAAPGIVEVHIAAPDDGSWDAGDAVQVAVVFAEPVEVATAGGTPSLEFDLTGAGAHRADYTSGSGTDRLAFAYTLAADDGTVSTVSVAPSSLSLNGGSIVSTGGLDAALAHVGASHASVSGAGTALPVLSVADAQGTEGGTLAFAVTLTPAAQAPVTVDYATADDTAVAGEDYTAASGTLTFAAGETEKTVDVTVLGDSLDEGAETLTLVLSNASGATVGDGEATGTVSDPGPAPLTGSFSGAPPEHNGSRAFTVFLTFSEAPTSKGPGRLKNRTVRETLFEVTGATVRKANRVNPPSNLSYKLRLVPAGDGAVTLALATLPACGEKGSVCTADGRGLTGPLALTVPGPAALSVADARVREGRGRRSTSR